MGEESGVSWFFVTSSFKVLPKKKNQESQNAKDPHLQGGSFFAQKSEGWSPFRSSLEYGHHVGSGVNVLLISEGQSKGPRVWLVVSQLYRVLYPPLWLFVPAGGVLHFCRIDSSHQDRLWEARTNCSIVLESIIWLKSVFSIRPAGMEASHH